MKQGREILPKQIDRNVIHGHRYPEFFLIVVFIAIETVKRYTKPCKTLEDFTRCSLIFSATLRELTIANKAMKYILANPQFGGLVTPACRKIIVECLDVLDHEYFELNNTKIFKIISQDLVVLKSELLKLAQKLENKEILFQVIEDIQQDLKKIHRSESLLYLESLEKQIRQF